MTLVQTSISSFTLHIFTLNFVLHAFQINWKMLDISLR